MSCIAFLKKKQRKGKGYRERFMACVYGVYSLFKRRKVFFGEEEGKHEVINRKV
jgi:hypothetical protein